MIHSLKEFTVVIIAANVEGLSSGCKTCPKRSGTFTISITQNTRSASQVLILFQFSQVLRGFYEFSVEVLAKVGDFFLDLKYKRILIQKRATFARRCGNFLF